MTSSKTLILKTEDVTVQQAIKERYQNYSKRYYQKNKEVHKQRVQKWQTENKKLYRALQKYHCAKRHKHIKCATPSWADLDKIKDIYLNCPDGHHVDHIVPLRGKSVSGLHVHTNLQYLPKVDNMKKSNTWF